MAKNSTRNRNPLYINHYSEKVWTNVCAKRVKKKEKIHVLKGCCYAYFRRNYIQKPIKMVFYRELRKIGKYSKYWFPIFIFFFISKTHSMHNAVFTIFRIFSLQEYACGLLQFFVCCSCFICSQILQDNPRVATGLFSLES